jgi:hypothetical protein
MTSEMAAMTLQNGGDDDLTRCSPGTCRSHSHIKVEDVVPVARWRSSERKIKEGATVLTWNFEHHTDLWTFIIVFCVTIYHARKTTERKKGGMWRDEKYGICVWCGK